ncbi:GMC family oxidoreductase [Aquamicrobium sp. LC103]|uniref:GMC family oxidoreductase n=1 Tax=Aquamicrobium sp. LC103 TaxID=1120658 RepID=UPI00069CA938|nr:GMC family oxidoreductase [Aquamicrobium sp. LC103]
MIDNAQFDYVIVGSGAGGGPLAANLAKAGFKVLLMEAGGDEDSLNYSVPGFNGLSTEDETYRWDYYVRHYADQAQQERDPKFVPSQDGVLYPRASTLGGCTAHNALITVYPSNSDWDRIAEITGDESWNAASMRKYYEKLERCEYLSPAEVIATGHGSSGWLVTEKSDTSGSPQDWQLQTTLQYAVGVANQAHTMGPINPLLDPNTRKVAEEGREGYLTIPLATADHARNGPREFIRQVAAQFPENLTIWTGVYVTRILFADGDDNVAVGVEYLAGRNLYRADPSSGVRCKVTEPTSGKVHVTREVILACGTFNTPQLLMLSGIGPKEHLAEHGISARVNLPGVGRNLQDRYEVGVVFEMDSDWTVNADATFGDDPDFDAALAQWQATRTGVYTSSGSALAFLKRSSPDQPDPDLFVFALAAHFQGYFPRYFSHFEPVRNRFTWAVLKAHTRNTAGEVKLKSADPFDRPYVNFHYFEEGNDTDGRDIAAVVEAVGFARSMMNGSPYVTREVLPGPDIQGNEALTQWVRDQAWGHHCSCTCKIGGSDDPEAVLDGDFRVRGTRNLRVVDASVFPHIPGTFIVLPIYMISEKAATVIIAEARGAVASSEDLMPSTVPATNSSARGGIL